MTKIGRRQRLTRSVSIATASIAATISVQAFSLLTRRTVRNGSNPTHTHIQKPGDHR
jgi:hypothetical protein